MWQQIALIFIGLFIGYTGGTITIVLLLRSFIGDDFEIVKPKVKGTNNELRVDQQNIVKRWQQKRKEKKSSNQNSED
jgi:hypothetical protein